jgi:DNA-binding NarL/FixJ family response regulator
MKVLIADSNFIALNGLRTILGKQKDLVITGEARNEEELLEHIKLFAPDVVVIDYTSSGFSIDSVPSALRLFPSVKFVAVTPEQSAQTLVDALRGGVSSYIKKDCDISEIVDSVQETFKGKRFFCGQILETIHRANIDVNDIDFDALSCEPLTLSEREMEIITLIAEGHTNTQIAEMLFLSAHTVNTHRKNIMGKLGVKNTAGIVMYAVKTNLVTPNKFLFAGQGQN